jgi:hypothetical protein
LSRIAFAATSANRRGARSASSAVASKPLLAVTSLSAKRQDCEEVLYMLARSSWLAATVPVRQSERYHGLVGAFTLRGCLAVDLGYCFALSLPWPYILEARVMSMEGRGLELHRELALVDEGT